MLDDKLKPISDAVLSNEQQNRRKFLQKAGKFAVYTTPAMMILMHPGKHAIASGGPTAAKAGRG